MSDLNIPLLAIPDVSPIGLEFPGKGLCVGVWGERLYFDEGGFLCAPREELSLSLTLPEVRDRCLRVLAARANVTVGMGAPYWSRHTWCGSGPYRAWTLRGSNFCTQNYAVFSETEVPAFSNLDITDGVLLEPGVLRTDVLALRETLVVTKPREKK